MAIDNPPSQSFLAGSGTTTYPSAGTQDGTNTAGSSSTIDKRISVLESIIIENPGTANGVLTLSDHAGGKPIVIPLLTAAARDIHYGPYGMAIDWLGIRGVLTGTNMLVRVLFRYA